MYKFASLMAIVSLSQAIGLRQQDNSNGGRGQNGNKGRGKGGALGKAFEMFDLNADGVLERDELESTLNEKGVSEAMTNAWLTVYDGAEG